MDNLESSNSDGLLSLIEELTTTGNSKLDETKCKKVKNICKISDENVRRSFYLIWSQLEKNHSEIRRSAVQLIDVLFTRSALFRELLLNNVQEFVELTLGTNHKRPIPLPYPAAKDMKLQTIGFLKNWHTIFGKAYKKLNLAINYLNNCKNMKFDDVDESVVRENERLAVIRQTKINAASNELNDISSELVYCLIEIENCFNLLLPCLEHFDIYSKKYTTDEVNNEKNELNTNEDQEIEVKETKEYRKHGLTSENISLIVNFDVNSKIFINKTDDNADILASFYEKYTLLKHKYSNILQKLLKVFAKCGATSNYIKPALDLKMSIDKTLIKTERIVVKNDLTKSVNNGESDEESNFDDFIDVPNLNDVEDCLVSPHTSTFSLLSENSEQMDKWKVINVHKDVEHDPTHAAATIKKLETFTTTSPVKDSFNSLNLEAQPSSSSSMSKQIESTKNDLRQKAPVVPYGIDLYHWGETDKELPLKSSSSQINWWVSRDEDDQVDREALASMKERVINFTGSFEPVKWKCRTPMSNGKLCFRMDRKKCPFHGVIIPRDNMGRPNGPDSSKVDSTPVSMGEESVKDSWRDPELEADISAAIGVDLTFDPKNKRKNNKNVRKSSLTDLKSLKNNTSYKRLEKKIFNKATVKRVASTMDNIDFKRIRDKFGNNFNYAHTK